MNKDYVVKKDRINRKLNDFSKKNNVNVDKFNENLIENFVLNNFKTVSKSSYYTNIKILNDILKDNDIDIKVDSKKYSEKCVQTKDNKFFTKGEIQAVCNLFHNYQDSFIVYALWCGIMGKNYSDLLNIKVTDVAQDYSYINLNGKRFVCDDYMKRIVRGTIKAKTYYKYSYSNATTMKDHFEFNPESEFLIKVQPKKTNGDGLNTLSPYAIQRRLMKLEEVCKEEASDDIKLNGLNLVKSGIMFDMFMKEVEDGKSWDTENIDEYLKMNGYKMNAADIYFMYHTRYHDSRVNVF